MYNPSPSQLYFTQKRYFKKISSTASCQITFLGGNGIRNSFVGVFKFFNMGSNSSEYQLALSSEPLVEGLRNLLNTKDNKDDTSLNPSTLGLPNELLLYIHQYLTISALTSTMKSNRELRYFFIEHGKYLTDCAFWNELQDEKFRRYFPQTSLNDNANDRLQFRRPFPNMEIENRQLEESLLTLLYAKRVLDMESAIINLTKWIMRFSTLKNLNARLSFQRTPVTGEWQNRTVTAEYRRKVHKVVYMHFICMAQNYAYFHDEGFEGLHGRLKRMGRDISKFNLHPYRYNNLEMKLPQSDFDTSTEFRHQTYEVLKKNDLLRAELASAAQANSVPETEAIRKDLAKNFLSPIYWDIIEACYSRLKRNNLVGTLCIKAEHPSGSSRPGTDPKDSKGVWFAVAYFDPPQIGIESYMIANMSPKLLSDCIDLSIVDKFSNQMKKIAPTEKDKEAFQDLRKKVIAHLRLWMKNTKTCPCGCF